jgi:starch-binding outer membrane protein SusE/F
MKKNLIIYLTFIGLLGLFTGCEEDGTKVVILTNPIAPTLKTIPDLTLSRANAGEVLEFVGTPVDPGFAASANYVLEACAAGNAFADAVTVYSGIQDTSIKITQSDLNGILLKKFPADAVSSVDFRIRSVLVVDAGTGAPGTSADPMVYSSAAKTADVTTYGLPRLDLIDSGLTQKIESAKGDGKYFGYVKLDAAKPFTLRDPDTGITYGAASGTTLAVNGAGITAATSGWHKLTADINALTYKLEEYKIGLVGSATPNSWNSPDTKMDYNSANGTWYINNVTLVAGDIKFRLNDGWAWNLGYYPGTKDLTNLFHNGDNITVEPGTYNITMTITQPTGPTEAGSCTLVKL